MEKLLVRGKCVCLTMLPPDLPGTGAGLCPTKGAGVHMQLWGRRRTRSKQRKKPSSSSCSPHPEEAVVWAGERHQSWGGKGWQRKQGVTGKAQWVCHCQFSALSPAKLPPPQPMPSPYPSPPRCCGQGGPLAVESLVQVSKKFKTKTHEMKWEFLCQVPSEPERLVYSLMKFLLQSLPLFSTRDLCFL